VAELQPISASLRRYTPAYASCGDWYRDCVLRTIRTVHAYGLTSQCDGVVAVGVRLVTATAHVRDFTGAGAGHVRCRRVATVVIRFCRRVRITVGFLRV
jgi:hypothetical protein